MPVADIFKSLNIEYYAALSYSDCREINHGLVERRGIEPKSVLLYLIPYYVSTPKNLSVYAASRDYHTIIRNIGERVISALSEKFPENKFYSYGDHSPIDERSAALAAGLGILGDNGLIINEKYGTYCFIGDVVSDLPISALPRTRVTEIKRCEGCGACRAACPTGILRGEGGDCLSAITQRKGVLTDDEVGLMRRYNTVWGCDLCQSACPHNKDPKITPIIFFHQERIELLTSDIISSMSEEELRSRAYGWRGRPVIERNLKLLGY